MKLNWPSFYIVGTPKGGTTNLYLHLKDIPEIFLPAEKELNYWSGSNEYISRSQTQYLDNFNDASTNAIIGEASPHYFSSAIAPKQISEAQPNAKIIVSLRNPINRLVSHILMRNRNLGIDNDLDNQISDYLKDDNHGLIKEGLYADHLINYYNHFESSQIKTLIFEEWISDQTITLENVLKFLGVENYTIETKQKDQVNGYKVYKNPLIKFVSTNNFLRKTARNLLPTDSRQKVKDRLTKKAVKPEISQVTREKLVEVYKPQKEKLENLLKREIAWEL